MEVDRILKILSPVSKGFKLSSLTKMSGQYHILPFYHTVCEKIKPHLFGMKYYRKLEDFKNDLSFFKQNFESVKPIDFQSKKKQFHVSFDDGLSDFYQYAMPELLHEKVHATMFINSDFIDNRQMFYKHKIALIKYEINTSQECFSKTSALLNTEKENVSRTLDLITDNKTLDAIADNINLDFQEYLQTEKPYLTLQQLREMQKLGFIIGNHSRNHPNFSTISLSEQKSQIYDAFEELQAKNLLNEMYFAFPFGDYKLPNNLFEWMYDEMKIEKSFGVSGLKTDDFPKHYHRILMEKTGFSAEEIIKTEYLYYILKIVARKNRIRR